MQLSNFLLNSFTRFESVVIPPTLSKRECIDAYTHLIYESSDASVRDSYSASISYSKGALVNWLTNDCADADTIKIVFGQYTASFKEAAELIFDEDVTNNIIVGKITAILVAVKNNAEVSAFDLGSIDPNPPSNN